MTTINCSSNCIYQKDGKCTLDDTSQVMLSAASDCAFYQPSENEIMYQK